METWDDFIKYPSADIQEAIDSKKNTPIYKIQKNL